METKKRQFNKIKKDVMNCVKSYISEKGYIPVESVIKKIGKSKIVPYIRYKRQPSKKQNEAVNWVVNFDNEIGYLPTYEQVAKGLKISKTAAYMRLKCARGLMRERKVEKKNLCIEARNVADGNFKIDNICVPFELCKMWENRLIYWKEYLKDV